jgi:hypothetical protein
VNARARLLAAVASLVLVAACGSEATARPSPPAVGATTGTPSPVPSAPGASTGPLPSASARATGAVDRAGVFPGGLWATQGTTLLISADGGTSWRAGTLPSPSPLAVDVLDAGHAWACTRSAPL